MYSNGVHFIEKRSKKIKSKVEKKFCNFLIEVWCVRNKYVQNTCKAAQQFPACQISMVHTLL